MYLKNDMHFQLNYIHIESISCTILYSTSKFYAAIAVLRGSMVCLAGVVANVADLGRCNPKIPSSIPAGGNDFS